MDRRGFLRGTLGTLSAALGAFALGKGVDGRASVPDGVQGRQGVMTLVQGPDPDHYVHVGWNTEWSEAIVLAPEPFIGPDHRLAIPRAQFPEYDERHAIPGVVLASNPMRGASGYNELVRAIRSAYAPLLR